MNSSWLWTGAMVGDPAATQKQSDKRNAMALVLAALMLVAAQTQAAPPPADPASPASKTEAAAKTPEKVEVTPVAQDDEIAARLTRILKATDWFREPDVSVKEGVDFLKGRTTDESFKSWAGDLAHKTRDVVAVVNQMTVDDVPLWDSSGVRAQVNSLGRSIARRLPVLVFSLVVLTVAWFISLFLASRLRRVFKPSMKSDLLRRVVARGAGVLVFLFAVYLVLQVAGLTRLALTLAGGTGVLGLVIGIAFKDITENFLASIYLSIQKPFEIGDLVEVNGMTGYVQRVTARTTILMTVEGNHLQIPNAAVFKNTLRNFTSNPNRRVDFVIGIGYDDVITQAQEIALQVLREHPAVLNDPDPWVLVEELAASTVNLRIYFWLDGSQHSWVKVRSAIMRLTKGAFQRAGISLPDESREIIFPQGVPVRMVERAAQQDSKPALPPDPSAAASAEAHPVSSAAKGGLTSDAGEIEEQARNSRMPEEGANLMPPETEIEQKKPDVTS